MNRREFCKSAMAFAYVLAIPSAITRGLPSSFPYFTITGSGWEGEFEAGDSIMFHGGLAFNSEESFTIRDVSVEGRSVTIEVE